MITVNDLLRGIRWLGHDSFLLEGEGKRIYVDPYRLPAGLPAADIVLVTHEHYDHCSPEDVAKVAGPKTAVLAPASAAAKLAGKVTQVAPGERHVVQGIAVETVAAYNIGKRFHPPAGGWVGYVVTLDGRRIWHAGDTDATPEARALKIDVALVPVGGTYTMTATEAAELVNAIRPKVAVPMHFGSVVGTEADAREFARLAQVPVEILRP